jgi:hypothetical protein
MRILKILRFSQKSLVELEHMCYDQAAVFATQYRELFFCERYQGAFNILLDKAPAHQLDLIDIGCSCSPTPNISSSSYHFSIDLLSPVWGRRQRGEGSQ